VDPDDAEAIGLGVLLDDLVRDAHERPAMSSRSRTTFSTWLIRLFLALWTGLKGDAGET
jgi:hypothetical protein